MCVCLQFTFREEPRNMPLVQPLFCNSSFLVWLSNPAGWVGCWVLLTVSDFYSLLGVCVELYWWC